MEVAPGIHRIESTLGPRPFSQYLLHGDKTLLVDTGVAETPQEVVLPFFESASIDPASLDFMLISHADVDHFGGNAAMRAAAPNALLCAHVMDAPWIQDSARILRERYGWYADHGIGYPPDTSQWLRDAMGADVPVDIGLQGGELIRLGPKLEARVLHLPGHSAGHLGLWLPASRTAIVMDAVMGRGLLDTEGKVIHPSPYFDIAGYEASAHHLLQLEPERLLTAHYDVMEGATVEIFIRTTLDFVRDTRQVVAAILERESEVTLARARTRRRTARTLHVDAQ